MSQSVCWRCLSVRGLWLVYMEISEVDRRLTPLAFSLARQSTVSSRDQEKFLSL